MDAQTIKKALLCAELNAQNKEKRIESPHVRYNESNQPVCRVCNVVLESESLWDAHQVSRKHRETFRRLRAAAFGATIGLLSMASMIIGVGSVEQDTTAMILSGFLVFVAQACSIATGEFMSVSSKLDKKVAPMKREKEKGRSREKEEGHYNEEKESWLNFLQAIAVQALAFAVGGMVPLLATSLIRKYKVGPRVVMATASFALVVSGWLRAVLGKTPVWKSIIMFLVEGWIFMTIPLGLSMFGKVDF